MRFLPRARGRTGTHVALAATLALAGAVFRLPVAADDAKTHVLYLGADFSVNWRGKAGRIVDVEQDTSLVLEVDGVRTHLRSASAGLAIQMEPKMKLGDDLATLVDVEGIAAFSAANNPHESSERGAAMAQDASALADLAALNLRNTEMSVGATDAERVADPSQRAHLGSAQQTYRDSLHANNAGPNTLVGQSAGDVGHDAFRLSFTVATPRALRRPYAMVFVRYLEQPDNPKSARIRILPLTLTRVDAKPRRYHLLQAGLPRGYHLDRFSLHIFEDGAEIATTASSKRVALSLEEAFQYTLVTHLVDPGDATQPAGPAREFWPPDLTTRLDEANRDRLVYLRVNPDGHTNAAFHDEAGRLPISDADIIRLLPELRFLPALDKGKPVPAMCRVNLGLRAL